MKHCGDDTSIRIDLSDPTREIPAASSAWASAAQTTGRETGNDAGRMRLLLHWETMPLAVVITTPEGVISDINTPAAMCLGLPIDQALQRKLPDFMPGLTPERLSVITRTLRAGRSVMLDGAIRKSDVDDSLPVEVAVSLCGGHGDELCFIIHDLQHHHDTEQALDQVQQRMAKAERLEVAGTVSGQIAHDFNNLLTPLLAYPSLIRRELADGSPALEFLRVMEKTAEDMAHMTQQLLALSRRGNVGDEVFNVNDVVQHVFALLSNDSPSADLDMAADLADDLLPARGGSDQMLRVVQNLCQNAVDAMPDGGCLRVVTENVYLEAPVGRYDAVEPGEYVRISVADTGPGIPEDIRDKIFEPFYTTKRGDKRRGSGLGLSIVHGIVRDHKGYIDLDSEPEKGTTFYLYLPVCREEAVVVPQDADYRGQNEGILVIDDDADQLRVIVSLCECLNYVAYGVGSGEDALAWLDEHPGECELAIVDMCLESGMDGDETWSEIHRREPRIASILVSGYTKTMPRIDEALRQGAGGYLKKPLTLASLGRAIQVALGKRSVAPPEQTGTDVSVSTGDDPRPPVGRVLLVDDEEPIRRMFSLVLNADIPGIEVLQAANGKEAVDLFQQSPSDVIVMDLHMPVMDGRQAFTKIHEMCETMGRRIPAVIFCTGFALPDYLKEVVDGKGPHALLRKPVRPDVLVKTIQERLSPS